MAFFRTPSFVHLLRTMHSHFDFTRESASMTAPIPRFTGHTSSLRKGGAPDSESELDGPK